MNHDSRLSGAAVEQVGRRWQGEDDPARIDTAVISFGSGSLAAHGTSCTGSYALSWVLETGEQWITKRLAVSAHGNGWSRHLELVRTDDGVWSSDSTANGECSLPAPGIADPLELQDALDCDLGLCPVTNTMPILRLNLLSAPPLEVEEVLTMAWVEVPSLRVTSSRQRYTSGRAAEGDLPAIVIYSSEDRAFTAELCVDPHGAVIDYPGLAKLLR